MAKTNEELYSEREQRMTDAIQLKVPDRVPLWFNDMSFFPARYAGITVEDAFYRTEKWLAAVKKTVTFFEPDMYSNPLVVPMPGNALDVLDTRQALWPGHGVSSRHSFQYVEGEYMKADEYDALLDDPTDFTLRIYLPRVIGALEPLATIPPLKTMLLGYFALPTSTVFAEPQIASAFKSFYQAGLFARERASAVAAFLKEMQALGFPLSCGGHGLVPFDLLSDMLRGMRGLMLDMYRQPDKVLAAIEKFLPMLIQMAVTETKASGNPRVFVTLHRGADGFMSPKQFETFYWPSLKKLIIALVDEGFTPCIFFEGNYTSRLEYLIELPAGKILGQFDCTDPVKAKKMLGNTMCIAGMMPVALLQIGSHEEIKGYAKMLIDVVGKGGGFIMGPGSAMDECDPERVKFWVQFTKEYGVYK